MWSTEPNRSEVYALYSARMLFCGHECVLFFSSIPKKLSVRIEPRFCERIRHGVIQLPTEPIADRTFPKLRTFEIFPIGAHAKAVAETSILHGCFCSRRSTGFTYKGRPEV